MFETPAKRILVTIGIIVLVGVGVFFSMNGGAFLKGDFSFNPGSGKYYDNKKSVQPLPMDSSIYTQTTQSIIPVVLNPAAPDNQLIVYRSSLPVFNLTQADTSSASPSKTHLLSQFTMCANTPNPVIISSISLGMYARAHVAFNADIDGTALWPQPLTYFFNDSLSFDQGYLNKTFDFLFEKPLILSSGGCKKMNVIATQYNQKYADAHWVLPVLKGVKANYPMTFLEKANNMTLPVSFSSNKSSAAGLGTLTLFDEPKPGPLYITKTTPQTKTVPADTYVPGNDYIADSALVNRFHNPVHITSLTFMMESTAPKQSFPFQLKINQYLQTGLFGNLSGSLSPATIDKTLSITPYTPLTIPVDMTLSSFGSAHLVMDIYKLPYAAASYRLKLTGIGVDAPVTFIDENGEWNLNGLQVLGMFDHVTYDTMLFTVTDKNGKKTTPADPPADPSSKKDDCSDCPNPDVGLSDAAKAAKSFEALYGKKSYDTATYSIPDTQKMIDEGKKYVPIGSFFLNNVNGKTSIPYSMNGGVLTVKSDVKMPLSVVLFLSGPDSSEKVSLVVTPGKPFVIPPQLFKGVLSMNIGLESLPPTVQQSFFVQAVINGIDVTYDGTGAGYTKGAKVPIFESLTGPMGPKLTSFPLALAVATFKQPGLYEKSTTNIAPPYTEVVDAASLADGQEFTMSSFCLTSTLTSSIQNFVFQHVVRDTSPFTSVSLDSGNVAALLTKNGWTKKTATFSYTAPLPLNAGESRCFNLKVFGPVSDDLFDMYFDLVGVKAIDASGNALPLYLKNGKPVSEFNPLKGTQYSFL